MDPHTQKIVNSILNKEAGYRMPVNPLADALHQKLAEDQDVEQNRKSNGATSPSSASSDGMEDKNEGYGKSTDTLEDDPAKEGAAATGTPQIAKGGKNITVETDGMKDLSIPHHNKSAALENLRRTSPSNRNRLKNVLSKYLG